MELILATYEREKGEPAKYLTCHPVIFEQLEAHLRYPGAPIPQSDPRCNPRMVYGTQEPMYSEDFAWQIRRMIAETVKEVISQPYYRTLLCEALPDHADQLDDLVQSLIDVEAHLEASHE